jgi:hypothetical protein
VKELWGYQLGDHFVNLAATVVKEEASVKVRSLERERKPVLTHSGFGDSRISEPYPDTTSTTNAVAAACGRLLKQTPKPNPAELKKFRRFVHKEIRRLFRKLKLEDIKSVEEWIRTRNRPGSWKQELLRELANVEGDVTKFTDKQIKQILAHIKQETYPEFKYPRGIFARQNPNKLFFGPIISAMEDIVYENEQFIKHVPVADRPAYISQMLGDFPHFACSDFKSFEGSFSREFQEACELQFFLYMIEDLPSSMRYQYQDMFKECILKDKEIGMSRGEIKLKVKGLRMSGEMWTSLANGVSNLLLWRYFCKQNGVECVGVVEGDDGLFGFRSLSKVPTTDQFTSLGFECKIVMAEDLLKASFCGIVFDPSVNVNITDPRPFLASLAWLPYRYKDFGPGKKKALMRAKALSFLFQYPGCPIIQSAGLWILRRTAGVDIHWVKEKSGFFNAYEEDAYADIFIKKFSAVPVAETTRELMSEQFGIPISDQIDIEHFFDNLESSEFTYPDRIFNCLFPDDWVLFAHDYKYKPISDVKKIKNYFKHWDVQIKDKCYKTVD